MIGGKAAAFFSPLLSVVIELFNATKQWLAVILAYWQGQRQGRKDLTHEITEENLQKTADIRDALNDADKRLRAEQKYGNHK